MQIVAFSRVLVKSGTFLVIAMLTAVLPDRRLCSRKTLVIGGGGGDNDEGEW